MKTALVARVPGAEPLVSAFRRRWDPSAAQGVPAHVKVLYPFKDVRDLTPAVLMRLRDARADIGPFDFTLRRVARF